MRATLRSWLHAACPAARCADRVQTPCYDSGVMLDARHVGEIVRALDQRFGLDTLWLFGSGATSAARPDSDLDLAALFRSTPEIQELLGARADLTSIVGREVDLVDLESASPILAMQVVRNGRLLHESSPSRRVLFVARLIARYEDLRRFRAPIEEAALRRTRGRA